MSARVYSAKQGNFLGRKHAASTNNEQRKLKMFIDL